jgi:uncharacterized membrane protein YraQ (UPF0718 family)
VPVAFDQALVKGTSRFAGLKADIMRRESLIAVLLLSVLVAGLIVYKTGSALRAIHTAQTAGQLMPRPYLARSTYSTSPQILWAESLAYLCIIWPALVFGVLISGAARMAIPQDWFASVSTSTGLLPAFSGGCSRRALNVVLLLRSSSIRRHV